MRHPGGWGTWVIGTWNFWDPMILWGSMKNSKKDVKMSKRGQNVKKMSKCQKDVKCQNVKHTDWRRFTKEINSHNEVHTYWCQFWHQIWRSPKLFKNTFYAHFEGFWSPSYVTSKLTSVCVNFIVSIFFFLWTSSIVHVFDFLTFDIFLTTWHLFNIFLITSHIFNFLTHGHWGILVNTADRDEAPWGMGHMGDGAHGQWGTWTTGHMGNGTWAKRIMVNIKDRAGVPWGMGHMGDGAHGQWGTWAIWHMIITSLILHGS